MTKIISIHVLRVEDNLCPCTYMAYQIHFNPRPPCGGQPDTPAVTLNSWYTFQSTSSVWRTTRSYQIPRVQAKFQSTSSVWRTTPQVPRTRHHCANFNPRPPCGGQQGDDLAAQADPVISIHVLRVEDNQRQATMRGMPRYFNPRPPCGGQLHSNGDVPTKYLFQSTSSVWRTTTASCASVNSWRFQSTSSVWRTTWGRWNTRARSTFQSTSSVWRTTGRCCQCQFLSCDFNPRPPCGGQLCAVGDLVEKHRISIHVLRVEDNSKNREKSLFAFI